MMVGRSSSLSCWVARRPAACWLRCASMPLSSTAAPDAPSSGDDVSLLQSTAHADRAPNALDIGSFAHAIYKQYNAYRDVMLSLRRHAVEDYHKQSQAGGQDPSVRLRAVLEATSSGGDSNEAVVKLDARTRAQSRAFFRSLGGVKALKSTIEQRYGVGISTSTFSKVYGTITNDALRHVSVAVYDPSYLPPLFVDDVVHEMHRHYSALSGQLPLAIGEVHAQLTQMFAPLRHTKRTLEKELRRKAFDASSALTTASEAAAMQEEPARSCGGDNTVQPPDLEGDQQPQSPDGAVVHSQKELVKEVLWHAIASFLVAEEAGYASAAQKSLNEEQHRRLAEIGAHLRELPTAFDFTQPHLWYPHARKIQRHFVLHSGPPNSGKTYEAMQDLINAPSGMYLAPLRLLAWENQRMMQQAGLPTSLITGQEKEIVPGAMHTAATVELADVSSYVDVCVIDECQLISDDARGAAWTRALLGVQARTVHVIEDGSVGSLVEEMCKLTGDLVQRVSHERLSPLVTEDAPLQSFKEIREGDCVVAFSRKRLYGLKQKIERETNLKCAVVYGSLPPETRKAQADLFNNPDSPYQVLVASDAIGMGLNLSIRRVIFSTLKKYDGYRERTLTPMEIRQIGGRAGRYSTAFEDEGKVTSMHGGDIPLIKEALVPDFEVPKAEKAVLGIDLDVIESLLAVIREADQHAASINPASYWMLKVLRAGGDRLRDAEDFSLIISLLQQFSSTHKLFELGTHREFLQIAEHISNVPLPLFVKYNFCLVPVNNTRPSHPTMQYLRQLALKLANGETPRLKRTHTFQVAKTSMELSGLEEIHSVLDLYAWLGEKFGSSLFPSVDSVHEWRRECAQLISESLAYMTEKRGRAESGNDDDNDDDDDDVFGSGRNHSRRHGSGDARGGKRGKHGNKWAASDHRRAISPPSRNKTKKKGKYFTKRKR